MASFGWVIVLVAVLLGAAIIMGNSGILPTSLFSTLPDSEAEQEIDTEKIALEIHVEVNEVRELYGLKPLAWSNTIAEIAKKHSQDMADRNYLAHLSPEGDDVGDRFEQAHFYCKRNLPNGDILRGGENIAEVSYPDDTTGIGSRVVQSWMNSPSHKANLLWETYEKEGIGIIVSGDVFRITQNFC